MTSENGEIPSTKKIAEVLLTRPEIKDSTRERRASTVRGWISWIWSQID